MLRVFCGVLLLALAGPLGASATSVGHGSLHARSYYVESFRAWMSEHGVTFGTKGEFERRLQIFSDNRYL